MQTENEGGSEEKNREDDSRKRIRKQKLLILLCCLINAFGWVGKYDYAPNIIPIMEHYGVTRADAGLVGTVFFFAYGIFQLIQIFFCKHYSKKWVITGMLFCSASVNLILFFRPPFACIKYLWLLNGLSHAPLWSAIILTLGDSVDRSMMKSAVMSMSASYFLGYALIYGGSALFNHVNFFQGIFLLAAVLMTVIGLVWCFSCRALITERQTEREEIPAPEKHGRKKIAASVVGLIAVCAFLSIPNDFIKQGMYTWTPLILKEIFGFGNSIAIILLFVFSVFGTFGAALALWTNRWIKDFCSLIGFFFLLTAVCLAGIVFSLRVNLLALFGFSSVCVVCLTEAILHCQIEMMPLALRDHVNSGFLTGLMNGCACIGGGISMFGMGKIADTAGWDVTFRVLFFAAAASALLSVIVFVLHCVHRKNAGTTVQEPPRAGT